MKTLNNPGQVVTGSFPLDKYAEQGSWSISVEATTANGKIESVYAFEVKEYVLPTFEVKINTDRGFIIEGEAEDVPIKIDAIYTFGQPVKVDAKVTIRKCLNVVCLLITADRLLLLNLHVRHLQHVLKQIKMDVWFRPK